MNLSLLHTAVTFAIVFSALVVFHELGHFLAAKMFKMRVEEFAIGFGKRIARVAFDGQTEYNIRAIPAGGFVRIAGMEIDGPPGSLDSETNAAAEGLETTNASTLEQETQEAADSPAADPDGFNLRPIYQRFIVIAAGPLFSFLLGWLALSSLGLIGLPDKTALTVAEFAGPKTVAQAAGLKPGDALIGFDGKTVDNAMDVLDAIHDHPNKSMTLIVRSEDGSTRNVSLVPAAEKAESGEGVVGRIGIAPDIKTLSYRRLSFAESLRSGTDMTMLWFTKIASLVRSGAIKDSVGGPITIVRATHSAAQGGLSSSVDLLGELSLSIGLMNLLPIPVLDGGHLVLMMVEAVRRRKLSVEAQTRVTMAGLAILGTLIVLIMFKDITGLFHH